MQITFEFEEFFVFDEEGQDGREAFCFLCHVVLDMVEPPTAGYPQSLNCPGEPPEPAVYEITQVDLINLPPGETLTSAHISLTLTETQFSVFFPGGNDVITNAFEWASEQEVEYDVPS